MDKVLKSWLHHQCRMISGLTHALVLTGPPDSGPYDRALYWPEEQEDHTDLLRVAQAALGAKQVVMKTRIDEVASTGEPLDGLACPLYLSGRLLGVVAMKITHRSHSLQQVLAQQIQSGTKWLEIMILLMDSSARSQMVNLIDLVAAGLDHETFRIAVTEVANEIAVRFNCHRVSLGFVNHNRLRIEALSHTSRIDHHSNLVHEIQDAMNESLDQGAIVVYPPTEEAAVMVSQFHARLAKNNTQAAVCTLPLVKNGKAVGALTLERNVNIPFTDEIVKQVEQIALLLGPVLVTRKNDERPLVLKIIDSAQHWCRKLFGPRHPRLKAGVAACLALLMWISMAHTTFRVNGDSFLEAKISRAVVAPQQGFIASAHVRAGDLVRPGDRLATLDDRELLLEQRKWQSQYAQLLKEYRKALTGLDRAEVAILRAKRAQAEAQLKLVEQQLERINMVAPFAGLVVKGDLSQAIGSPVERGDVLFEIAPTDGYRVVIMVEDRDMGLIKLKQHGRLKLSGIPDRAMTITIDRITPVSANESGKNAFRVEAVMDGHSDLFRPGMKGIAKIEIGRKKLIWIWTRPLMNWLRLFIWNRLP